MRKRVTYANFMATLALFLTMSGTAFAAVVLTGRNVIDRSLSTADFKNGSLTAADMSPDMKRSFLGARGPEGRQGGQGSSGETGDAGGQGLRGSAAAMTSAFAFRRTGLTNEITNDSPTNNNNGAGTDWDSAGYSSVGGANPQLNPLSAGYANIGLSSIFKPIVSLTGMSGADPERSAPSKLKVTFAGATLNATATLTFLHRAANEDPTSNTGGTLVHGRLECRLFYGSSDNPDELVNPVGIPAYASSGHSLINHELVNISLNGNAGTPTAPIQGGVEYNVAVKCRDLDSTDTTSSRPEWQLDSGNMVALASR
ncbi:MAG: hypothetical protein JWM86_448 [Thermoleophilia bacterium]|nr:hypothetical protein [Thermoleophilia bacterium]